MSTLTRTRRTTDCLSDLQLDSLLEGEKDLQSERVAQSHAAVCARCKDRWSELRHERDEYLASHPRFERSTARAPRGRRTWVGIGAASLAAAAILLLGIRGREDPVAAAERTKGNSSFGFYVRQGESVVRGSNANVVHPGDQLRFVVHSRRPQIAILSVDGARSASVYYPDVPRTVFIDAHEELPLPRSTRLDGALGHETIHALFCEAPTDLTPALEALRAHPGAPPVVPGCEVQSMTLEKLP